MAKSVDQLIEEANGRLKIAGSKCRISRQGDSLYLRGTLPAKPTSSKTTPHQQTIALGCFGWKANAASVKAAEQESKIIDGAIADKAFDWGRYLKKHSTPDRAQEWVKRFEEKYFEDRRNKDQRKVNLTWSEDYRKVFKNLADEPLTVELLVRTIEKTKSNTRQRERYCQTFKALARFAGLELDVSGLIGNYSTKTLTPRDLPSDEELIKWRSIFTEPSWEWAYLVLCTYGLRNHEVFYVEESSIKEAPGIINVLDGKTGGREVWGFYPEWWEEFNLKNVKIPQCSGKTNGDLGHRVSQAFRRYKQAYIHSNKHKKLSPEEQKKEIEELEKITPYNLRHCWSIRTILLGIPDRIAAAQQGHSLELHEKIYHRWLDRRHHQQVYDSLLKNEDRLKPPGS